MQLSRLPAKGKRQRFSPSGYHAKFSQLSVILIKQEKIHTNPRHSPPFINKNLEATGFA